MNSEKKFSSALLFVSSRIVRLLLVFYSVERFSVVSPHRGEIMHVNYLYFHMKTNILADFQICNYCTFN